MDAIYKEEILDHYKNPRNYGKIEKPSIHVEANNPLCGDRLQMDLLLEDGIVKDVRFEGRGCAISQASASMLTEEMLGRSLADLAGTTRQDVLDNLGIVVSYARLKCALLSLGMLRQAVTEAGLALPVAGSDDE
ncbi:MAG: SUF system NifU family Fe-S cluster assembly protein [Chloroflexota bacterium]|nr:SUF system NifU family Fe-S cluster assembly protein [Chloroflexota bacterium]